jgi:hypothetical protein
MRKDQENILRFFNNWSERWRRSSNSLAQIAVAAVTAEYCGGCGSALLSADVTYAQTGSYRDAAKAGAITYGEAYANTWIGEALFAKRIDPGYADPSAEGFRVWIRTGSRRLCKLYP